MEISTLDQQFLNACGINNFKKVIELLEQGADINVKEYGKSALYTALWQNNKEMAKLLIDKGADVNTKEDEAYGGTMALTVTSDIELVKLLIEKGADVNAQGGCKTALMEAALLGNIEKIKLLLDNGADINAISGKLGVTVLTNAFGYGSKDNIGNIKTIKFLIERGADVNAKDANGYTVLMRVLGRSYTIETFQLLIDSGADINAGDNSGQTVLMIASRNNHPAIVNLLIEKGAEVNAKDDNGMTAYDYANSKIKKLLKPKVEKINLKKNRSKKDNYIQLVKELIKTSPIKNNELIADSFSYVIGINKKKINNENDLVLGSSKIKGLPHLPPDFQWPEGYYFYAQLNMEELHKYDIENKFPSDGMLYLFLNCTDSQMKCNVIYHNGESDKLNLTGYPENIKLPNREYYLDDFKKNSYSISFYSFFSFNDFGIKVPDEIIKKIENILNCKFKEYSSQDIPNIFGEPLCPGGEDGLYDLMYLGKDDIDDTDKIETSGKTLLFQNYFADGIVHIWIDNNDLKRKDFSNCFVTYSGT
jgi:ankyrin repeat protein